MKAFLVFAVFLLLSPVVMAQGITIPNITIRIPNITIRGLPNITVFNQTRVSDILDLFEGTNITNVLAERANSALGYLFNRILENIVNTINNSLPQIIEILLKGNTTD
ncbi:MAG: hypothetical protein ABIE55_01585 [Candidatus Aenigmatarchaeota archaeon]